MTRSEAELAKELKRIQDRLVNERYDLDSAQRKVDDSTKELRATLDKIANLKRLENGIEVTDHALVRFIERVLGMDVEGMRKKIGSDTVVEAARNFQTGIIKISDDCGEYRVRFEKGKVITVMPIGRDKHGVIYNPAILCAKPH